MNPILELFFYVLLGLFVVAMLTIIFLGIRYVQIYLRDRRQEQHSVKRTHPGIGNIRYLSEAFAPEIRQYFVEGDEEGKPYSRLDFQAINKAAKYSSTLISFGSKRDFETKGYYIRNAFLPKQLDELRAENDYLLSTKKYVIKKIKLTKRVESSTTAKLKPWLYHDDDKIVIGEHTCEHPFIVKSPVGMSGMSYGALGENAITALSLGLGMAKSFMNTGEGGLSEHHLASEEVDIICQIGPGKFGFRNEDGTFSYEEVKKKANLPQVKAFELKLGQGAKIRGGHVEAAKVTPEIAKVRGVKPYQTIDSPNRFEEFSDEYELLHFIQSIRDVAQKPIGIKIVLGDKDGLVQLCQAILDTKIHPDFLSVDGAEGGTGATYKAMADSVGLPIRPAIMIVDETLKRFGIREQIKIIASGKLYSADRIAIAMGMGADLVQLARGLMVSVGCIGAQICASNDCPVGVATTNKKLQYALVVDEKKYRVLNYVVTLREELFTLAAAAGLLSPNSFGEEHIVYKTEEGIIKYLSDIKRENGWNDIKVKLEKDQKTVS